MRLTTPEISWHGKEPLFSLDFSLNNKSTRLATSGADSNIRIWAVHVDDGNGSKAEFIANLSRHTKAVNVVRFSPEGNMLASGGDDCYVIIWKLNDDGSDAFSQPSNINSEDIENKESWQVAKMLRGHIEDVYDLAWSPNATQLISGSVDNSVIIWDTNKGDKLRIVKDHRQYVQGVAWDPCGSYVATYSCDRACRIYNTSNYRCCFNIHKMTLTNSLKMEQGDQNSKQVKIFHDETMPSFFRRLTFSPDGLLLLVPGGKLKVNEKAVNTTFVFTKASMNKPVMYFPATKKPTIAVRCCPILFENRNTEKCANGENKKSVFKLPYRMVIAVASLDCVVLYDTQQSIPFGFLSNMHYASLTDIAWSGDGRILAISSRDGYCSLVTFDNNELGVPYGQSASQVIENVRKESSPARRNAETVRSETPESVKDERISPKIEKLSIRNFVTINPSSTNTSSAQDGGQGTTKQRLGFVPAQPSPETKHVKEQQSLNSNANSTANSLSAITSPAIAMATQPQKVNFTTLQLGKCSSTPKEQNTSTGQSLKTNSLSEAGTKSPSTTNERPNVASSTVQQPRRVGFVTIKPSNSTATHSGTAKKLANHTQGSNVTPSQTKPLISSEIEPGNGATTVQQPRRVGFVTLKSSQNPAMARGECTPVAEPPPPPRRVNFVTIPSPQASLGTNEGQNKSQNAITTGTSNPSAREETSNKSVPCVSEPRALARTEKPPVPLEPEVIIIND